MPHLRISEAAGLLGVSDDTVRRYLDSGRLAAGPPAPGPRTVDSASLAALLVDLHPRTVDPTVHQSARNRFPGI